jgi:RNA polymerase sigma factor (sigma-70 family)|tara:strand:- start:261 stop:1040 length:780 start_codon:yes stop_codon:yes gene_type:complete
MKYYNVEGYVRHKLQLEKVIEKNEKNIDYNEHGDVDYTNMTDKAITIMWMPLCEALARKFATSQQASGVMDITDLISCGYEGLCKAVKKLDRTTLVESEDTEKTIKSFFAKRIRGAIRRQVDKNRGDMRIPEHKYNEIRKNFGKDKKAVAMFFNSVFLSIDAPGDDNMVYDIPDESEPYNQELLNMYLISLLQQHLNDKEFQVLRLSYGLDCDKHSATEIANKIGIEGTSSYVRVSQLKKQAVDKLIENVDHSQVLDYL